MEHWQSWPFRTSIGSQTFAGARLSYEYQPDHTGSRLRFDFARQRDEQRVWSRQRLLKTFPASIDAVNRAEVVQPYRLLVTANRFLRHFHPQVDLPKELLLSHLLEDQEQEAASESTAAPKLASCINWDQTELLISAGGHLSNELYCSAIRHQAAVASASIASPRFYATSTPSLTFSTPILQLASGPSSTSHHPTLFLARTFQSTYFFVSYQIENCLSFDPAGDSPLPRDPDKSSIALAEITTQATRKTAHVDACIGQDPSGESYGVLVDSKGGVWKTNDQADVISCSRLGIVKDSENDSPIMDWARCGTMASDDRITVGLRKSVQVIDPRAGPDPATNLFGPESNKKLFSLQENHLLTDIQRHPSRLDPHLRFINTTRSLICLDDRKPGTPLLTISHSRTHDLTLGLSFPSEFGSSSAAMDINNKSSNSKMSPVILWSRKNDAASLYPLNTYTDRPPNLIGYPHSVPVLSTRQSNPRCGLVCTIRSDRSSSSKHLSVVEMTKDGALWHQIVSLEDTNEPSQPQSQACLPSIQCVWDRELYKRDEESAKVSHLQGDGPVQATLLPDLSDVCRDFLKTCTPETGTKSSTLPTEKNSMVLNYLTRPLEFAAQNGSCSSIPGAERQSGTENCQPHTLGLDSGMNGDLRPMLDSLLYSTADRLLKTDLGPTMPEKESDKVDHLISVAVRNSLLCTTFTTPQSNSNLPTEITERANDYIDLVDRLMDEWPMGVSTSEYEWKHISIDEGDEDNESMGYLSSSSRRQSPTSQHEDFNFRTDEYDALTKINVKSSRKQILPTTPRKTSHLQLTSPIGIHSQQPTANSESRSTCDDNYSGNLVTQSQSFSASLGKDCGVLESQQQEGTSSDQLAFSQIVPGPHGDRNNSGAPAKKKKRLGGF